MKLRLVFILVTIVSLSAFSQRSQEVSQLMARADSIYFSNPDSSYALSCSAEKMLKDSSDLMTLAHAKISKGRYLLLKTNLEEAEMEFNGAYGLYEILKDTGGLAYVLKLKSILQERLGNDKDAILLLEESILMNKQMKNYEAAIGGLLNLMQRYTESKDFYKVETIGKEINSLDSNLSITSRYFFTQNLGMLELARNNYSKALNCFLEAKETAFENNMIDSKATILMLIARAYRLKGDLVNAIKSLKESEVICEDNKLEGEMLDNYNEYVLCYEKMGNYKEAFRYQQLKEVLSEKILNIDRVNKVAALEKKIALTQKQKEIEVEKVKTQEERDKSTRLYYFLAFVAGVSVLLVFLFVRARNLKNKIQEKSNLIEEKQKEILDSIHYAKRIQSAMLTSETYIKKYLSEFFILYKPKDIVSGDFYWSLEHEGKIYIAVADCTGHGVPGAFMSMIGINLLSQIIVERKINNPGLVLDVLREEVIRSLSGDGEETRDGIDMVLIKIDRNSLLMEYAGANNSVYVYHTEVAELLEYKGSKMPVGRYTEHMDSFEKHAVQLKGGDLVYAFSDGYPDQFGGPKGKKFKYKQLENLLAKNAGLPVNNQKVILEMAFDEWKGDLEQIDDVCVAGIRV